MKTGISIAIGVSCIAMLHVNVATLDDAIFMSIAAIANFTAAVLVAVRT
jgi:hypothetical protein